MCVRPSHVISVSFPLSSFAVCYEQNEMVSAIKQKKLQSDDKDTGSGSQVTVCTLYTFKMHGKRTHRSTQQQNQVTKLLILKAKSQNVEIA